MKKIFFLLGIVMIAGVAVFALGRKQSTEKVPQLSPADTEVSAPSSQDFTFRTPDGYKLYETSPEEGQQLFTVENAEGKGFQIFVIEFDEEGPITEERIRQDLPDAVIDQPGQAKLDGELSFLFYGNDEDLGDTFEVWVVHKGKLFQIMGKKSDEKLIETMLDSWKWK